MKESNINPFHNCPALDGYHCQTNSLAKIFHYHCHPLSEDMILGLGAGMGFIYWQMKMGTETYVFVGGRGNIKGFFNDLAKRTGVEIKTVSTASSKKAEASLLEKLNNQEPVMLFGDMGFLPWFDMPKDYHFGGHTFVACGFDGKETILVSDMDQSAAGLKKGFYYPVTLAQLSQARGSKFKPFPPKNTYLEFDFKNYHEPGAEDIGSAIKQTADSQLNPPIKNFGVKGIRYTAKQITKWPEIFDDRELRMNLFNLYIFIEIGGTGGGCFRFMYSRFLKEAAEITGNKDLKKVATMFSESGKKFTEIGVIFKEAERMNHIKEKIFETSTLFSEIADIEEGAHIYLGEII